LNYYKHKSQGDNLIDVLEVGDIIVYSGVLGTKIISDINSDEIYFITANIHKTLKKDAFNVHVISGCVRIITHEQYMKLAQDVI
jgi:hypothetical protein